MFIELIDLLRCPRDHEESWLVAAFEKMDGRFVVSGKLGCPVCAATYPIEDGTADLRDRATAMPRPSGAARSPQSTEALDSESSIRFAAMLGLTRPGMLIITTGDASALSHSLSELSRARIIALNPAAAVGEDEGVAAVLADERIPLAAASADGAVMGARHAIPVAEFARVLKTGGRLVAAADLPLGPQFRELARDATNVVAEKLGELITLNARRETHNA